MAVLGLASSLSVTQTDPSPVRPLLPSYSCAVSYTRTLQDSAQAISKTDQDDAARRSY